MSTPTNSLQRLHRLSTVTTRSNAFLAPGLLSLPLYALATLQGEFRPDNMEPFFPIFGALFVLYAVACWQVLRRQGQRPGNTLFVIFAFAIGFNALLLPSPPTLSDDMYRYIWDGRVQAAGYNPYQYASNAPELAYLRDDAIWRRMNRPEAVTIYPPGAQMAFALTWRIFPDSVVGMKLVMISLTLLAGWLLVVLLKTLDQSPERVLIFLWNPLLIFEIAHGVHVDALYLPLIVGAFLLRVRAPQDRVDWRYETGIGILLGLGVLVKLYPAILAPCLWSLRTSDGKRQWRFTMPMATVATIVAGYLFYLEPDVDVFGFLGTYGREFFNVSPHMHLLIDIAREFGIAWYEVGNYGMPALIVLVTAIFVLFPARTPREAVMRCMWPMGIYLLINHNLFSWYLVWIIPHVALVLNFRFNMALVWWTFTGTSALSYVFFINWRTQDWAIQLEFWPLYLLMAAAGITQIITLYRGWNRKQHTQGTS